MLVKIPMDRERHVLMVLALANASSAAIMRGEIEKALAYLALVHDVNYIHPSEWPPLRAEELVRERLT